MKPTFDPRVDLEKKKQIRAQKVEVERERDRLASVYLI